MKTPIAPPNTPTTSEPAIAEHTLQILNPFDEPAAPRHLKLSFAVRKYRDRLEFDFVFQGRSAHDLAAVVFAERKPQAARRHELWKTTCLEIFFGPADQGTYVEINLSPSGDWQAYAFDGYRAGSRELEDAAVELHKTTDSLNGDSRSWHASISGAKLKELLRHDLVMNATAVVEYTSGDKEYWALVHAGPKPDFHLRESFRLIL